MNNVNGYQLKDVLAAGSTYLKSRIRNLFTIEAGPDLVVT